MEGAGTWTEREGEGVIRRVVHVRCTRMSWCVGHSDCAATVGGWVAG